MSLSLCWNEVSGVFSENSFGIIDDEDDASLTFNLKVGEMKTDGSQYGSFEWYSGDQRWYAEGGLWFQDNELKDYDGCFSLASQIIEKLHEHGYNVKDIAKVCAPELRIHEGEV